MLTREGISSEDKELLVVGFIEDLQGAIAWARLDAKPFYALLGPKSRVAWDDLMKMWDEIARKKASGELQPGVAMPEVEDAGLRKLVQQIFRPPTK